MCVILKTGWITASWQLRRKHRDTGQWHGIGVPNHSFVVVVQSLMVGCGGRVEVGFRNWQGLGKKTISVECLNRASWDNGITGRRNMLKRNIPTLVSRGAGMSKTFFTLPDSLAPAK